VGFDWVQRVGGAQGLCAVQAPHANTSQRAELLRLAYLWESGRDPEFSVVVCGRTGHRSFLSGVSAGIYGNDSTVAFEGLEGTGKPQRVSFYYQNTDDMGFGGRLSGTPERIGGSW
jgi:hypothetical protein